MRVNVTAFGRVLRTGLSSLRDRAANLRCRLAALRFNPSRISLAASLPKIETVKKVVEHALETRSPDERAIAEMAMRWGYMHGQWDARREIRRQAGVDG